MVAITLPDGKVRSYPGPVTGLEVAKDIGAGLAKAALAVRIDGDMKDLSAPIESDCRLAVVTQKDPDALDLLR
ncbi:MAG: TGS domain-containing protein, partial [Magnetospirillum sp.]